MIIGTDNIATLLPFSSFPFERAVLFWSQHHDFSRAPPDKVKNFFVEVKPTGMSDYAKIQCAVLVASIFTFGALADYAKRTFSSSENNNKPVIVYVTANVPMK